MLLNLFLCIATLTRTFKCALMLTPAFYNMQVSRDAETGISRGTAFITMRSLAEARTAINALDGFVSHTTPQLQLQFLSLLSKMELLHSHIVNKCIFVARTNPSSYESLTCTVVLACVSLFQDLDGREIFAKLASDVISNRKNVNLTHITPTKDHIFESPHKIYVGNLAWSVQPQDLRELFTQCGTVVSTRLLTDRKGGRNRVYGFLSFSSAEELEAALKLDKTVRLKFCVSLFI